MAVDDARHDVFAGAVDYARVRRGVEILADSRNLAVAQKHVGVLQRAVRDGEHGRVANERFGRGWSLRACGVNRQRGDDC